MAYINGKKVLFSPQVSISNDVTDEYNNIVNREMVAIGADVCRVHIGDPQKDPIPAGVYVCNIPRELFYAASVTVYDGLVIADEYNIEAIEAIDGGTKITLHESAQTMTINYSSSIKTRDIMLIEGETLPQRYKPYGTAEYFKDEYLDAVYDEIAKKPNEPERSTPYQLSAGDKILTILETNHIHDMVINDDVNFVLPTTANNGDQIIVQAVITIDVAIDWGTTYFYNEAPVIEVGEYEFIFTWINGKWCVGVLSVREGENV